MSSEPGICRGCAGPRESAAGGKGGIVVRGRKGSSRQQFKPVLTFFKKWFKLITVIIKRMEKEIFSEFIIRNNLRSTPQRMLILEEFLKYEGHVSAEELHDRVKLRDGTVGQATVYRALKLISEAGLARQVDLSDGSARYEHLYNHKHHDHLVCVQCRKTIEVMDESIERMQSLLAKRHGFNLIDHEMYLYGVCGDCSALKLKH